MGRLQEPFVHPECEQGKHANCDGDVLLDDVVTLVGLQEEYVDCECSCHSSRAGHGESQREDPENAAIRRDWGVGGDGP